MDSENITEDEILRQRLSNDNEGNGEERRWHSFVKTYIAHLTADPNTEEAEANRRKLLLQLETTEFGSSRLGDVAESALGDENYLATLLEDLRRAVSGAREAIKRHARELEVARSQSRVRHEFNAISQSLKKNLDMAELGQRRELLEQSKAQRAEKLASLTTLLDAYRSEYSVFLNALVSLKQKFEKAE